MLLGVFNDDWSVGPRYHLVKLVILVILVVMLFWSLISSTVAAAGFEGMYSSSPSDPRYISSRSDTGVPYADGFMGGNGAGGPVFWNIGDVAQTKKTLADAQKNYEGQVDWKESALDWKESMSTRDPNYWRDLGTDNM